MDDAKSKAASEFNVSINDVTPDQMTFTLRRLFWNDEVFWKTLQEGGYNNV